jgi:hypothetical protein
MLDHFAVAVVASFSRNGLAQAVLAGCITILITVWTKS